MISPSFSSKLNQISNDLGMNPRDLLLVIFLESGGNPAAHNKSGATGLIQFMPDTLKDLGVPKQDIPTFGQKSAIDQLDYVKKYVQSHRWLIGGKPFTSATQYYVANLYPAALKKWNGDDPRENANVIVINSRSNDPQERAAYTANKGLDTNKDGIITVSDITNSLMGLENTSDFQQMLDQFNAVAGNGNVSERNMGIERKMKPQTPSNNSNVDNMVANYINNVNKFLDNVAMEKQDTNKYLIKINSNNDLPSKLEYARVLSIALKEELNAKSEIFTDNNSVDLQCIVMLEKDNGLKAIQEISNAVSDVFTYATKHIGNIKVNTLVIPSVKSKYQKLDIKIADISYRQFHMKFVKGKT